MGCGSSNEHCTEPTRVQSDSRSQSEAKEEVKASNHKINDSNSKLPYTSNQREKKIVKSQKTTTDPKYPGTEKINRTLKTMIASFVGEHHEEWDKWLTEFRFAINSSRHETTGRTPAELALGRQLKGPLERLIHQAPVLDPQQPQYSVLERQHLMAQEVRRRVGVAKHRQARYYNAHRRPAQFLVGDLVWVRAHPQSKASDKFSSKLAPKWTGPATVMKILGPVNYRLKWQDNSDKLDTVNVGNLKPYFRV